MNGSPCSRNTSASFRAFFIIRDSFPPVILWCCVILLLLLSLSYSYMSANSCSNLDSSGVMTKNNLSSAFSFWLFRLFLHYHIQCPAFLLNPRSGDIEVNPVTLFVTHKFPFTNLAKMSECCLSVSCIVLMYRWSTQA